MTDPMTCADPTTLAHLDALTAGAGGWLVVSVLVPGAGRDGGDGWRSASFAVDQVDEAAAAIAHADSLGFNVYVRTNLVGRPLTRPTERGVTADTACVTALAVDLDVAGPGHAPSPDRLHPLPPDRDTAERIVAELPEPTLRVATGGGEHLWWRLDEPEVDDPVGLIEEWKHRTVAAAAAQGWHLDTPDATRVLRPAGSHRRKTGCQVNRVQLVGGAGWPTAGIRDRRPWVPAGYGARDLLERLPARPPPEPAPPPRQPRRESRPGEVSPADAVASLAWAQILQPFGWTYAGSDAVDGVPVEKWLRPGDPASAHSIKCKEHYAIVNSDACGLPQAKGSRNTKFRVFCILSGLTESDAARAIGARAKEVRFGV